MTKGETPGMPPHVAELGKRLSKEIRCPVHFPGYGKNMFVCEHGHGFPLYRLRMGDDWAWVIQEHKEVVGC